MATKKKQQIYVSSDAPENIPASLYGMTLDDDQLAFANAIWDRNNDIVMANARAGTGKTTIATGVAIMLVKYGFYDGIVYIMSPYGERKQGYLPGDIQTKSEVYFEPFYQALITCNENPNTAITNESMVNQKNGTGYITCITDTYLRGTNLDDAIILMDECQNATVSQLKTILTRVGKNAKVICIGHDQQCDLADPSKSGFARYIEHFRGCDRAAICELKINHRSWISQHADELIE